MSYMSYRTMGFMGVAAILASAAPVHAAVWDVDPAHTSVTFKVRHMMVSNVSGEFGKVRGTVDYDSAQPSKLSADIAIDVESLNTREPQRDAHLKSPDFFDAAKYPTITFKSTKAEQAGKGKLKVTGDLTIRGTTRPAVLYVEDIAGPLADPMGMLRVGASLTTSINRQDFGVSWNKVLDNGGVIVGDQVAITIGIELMRKK